VVLTASHARWDLCSSAVSTNRGVHRGFRSLLRLRAGMLRTMSETRKWKWARWNCDVSRNRDRDDLERVVWAAGQGVQPSCPLIRNGKPPSGLNSRGIMKRPEIVTTFSVGQAQTLRFDLKFLIHSGKCICNRFVLSRFTRISGSHEIFIVPVDFLNYVAL
jgi:hypothetical protein